MLFPFAGQNVLRHDAHLCGCQLYVLSSVRGITGSKWGHMRIDDLAAHIRKTEGNIKYNMIDYFASKRLIVLKHFSIVSFFGSSLEFCDSRKTEFIRSLNCIL